MSKFPLVSVVIPVFNGERTITRAIESVFAQTFADFEIIVIDDGSTDQTVDLITQWGNDRLKLIRHPHNRGAGAARNSGIAMAGGRWIAFLDSDDSWKPEKLARQVAVLERVDSSVRACATGYYLHKDGRDLTISLNILPRQFRREILFGCTISPGTTLLVDRRMFDDLGGFDEELKRLEDWDWLLRFSERYDMAFVNEPLADVYLTRTKPLGRPSNTGPVHDAIRRIGMKHISRLALLTNRMQLQSSLLVERAAELHRRGKPFAAALVTVAALVVYPFRNAAFFRTLWHSARGRLQW